MNTIKYTTTMREAFLRAAIKVAEAKNRTVAGLQGAESVLMASNRNAGFLRVPAVTKGVFGPAENRRFGVIRFAN